MAVRVEVTPEFQRNIKRLSKKYRYVRDDLEPVIEKLKAGHLLGNRIPGAGFTVFKVRVKNTDTGKGERGGYRLLYYQSGDRIVLLTVYSKLMKADLTVKEIRRILREFEGLKPFQQ